MVFVLNYDLPPDVVTICTARYQFATISILCYVVIFCYEMLRAHFLWSICRTVMWSAEAEASSGLLSAWS